MGQLSVFGVANGVEVGEEGAAGGIAPAALTESPASRVPDTTAVHTRRHIIEEAAYATTGRLPKTDACRHAFVTSARPFRKGAAGSDETHDPDGVAFGLEFRDRRVDPLP